MGGCEGEVEMGSEGREGEGMGMGIGMRRSSHDSPRVVVHSNESGMIGLY